MTYECIIVGGGPAGLSAALVAGRARRRVLLVDDGQPRNAAAPAVHSFVTRDGVLPRDFRRIAREEIAAYPTVTFADRRVSTIDGQAGAFRALLEDGRSVTAKRVLLAMGLVDTLPDIPGVRERWGHGVHHCPYCDGYEHRDGAWGVLADQPLMFDWSPFLRAWTRDLTLFTNGDPVPAESAAKLDKAGIRIVREPIARILGGEGHRMKAVELAGGRRVPIDSFWVRPVQGQTELVARLGLPVEDNGAVRRDEKGETPIAGIFAAGDLAAGPVQQALIAAADGARVTFAINHELVLDSSAEPARVAEPVK